MLQCHIDKVRVHLQVCQLKGSHLAEFNEQNHNDEVTLYQNTKYVSASKVIWRKWSFPIHERFHLVTSSENNQEFFFHPNNIQIVEENPRNVALMVERSICKKELPAYYIK